MAIAANDPNTTYVRLSDIATVRQLLKMRYSLEFGARHDTGLLSVATNFWLDILNSIWSKVVGVVRHVLPIDLPDRLPSAQLPIDLIDLIDHATSPSPRSVTRRDLVCCRCQSNNALSARKASPIHDQSTHRLSARVPDIVMSNRLTPSSRPVNQYRSPQEIGRELRRISQNLERSQQIRRHYLH